MLVAFGAGINYLKFNFKATRMFYFFSCRSQKSQTDFIRLNSKCLHDGVSLESLGENLFPGLFQLLDAAYCSWLVATSL